MKEIRTETVIDKNPRIVWRVLTDFLKYPNWSSFINEIRGRPEAGERLNVTLQDTKGKKRGFKPKVLVSEPEKEFRWKGALGGMGWLFSGEHYFIIEEETQGRTRFVHGEKFTGFLVPMMWRSLNTDTRQGFLEFNKAIKRRTESMT